AVQTILSLSISRGPDQTSTEVRPEEIVPVMVRLERRSRRLRWRWPVLVWGFPVPPAGTATHPGLRHYAQPAKGVTASITEELAAVREKLGTRTLPIRLEVGPGLTGVPWEALLTLAASPGEIEIWRPLGFWRSSLSLKSWQSVPTTEGSGRD